MQRGTASSTPIEHRVLQLLWAAVAVQVAGRIVDGLWHASHDGFETTSDQLQAHWLIWLGVLFALVVAFVAVRSLRESAARAGYVTVLAAGVAYALAAGWHLYEHSQRNDPAVVHVLVGIAWVTLLVGVVIATILARRDRRA